MSFAPEPAKSYGLSPKHLTLYRAFLEEEAARGRRPRGVASLRHRVPWFLTFMEEREKLATEATVADAYAYQGELAQRMTRRGTVFSPRSVQSYVEAARVFCDWLCRSGSALDNPFASIRRVRSPETVPALVLTEREMARLLDELGRWDAYTNLRDQRRRYLVHVIAELQYASGLRIAEVAALEEHDLDLDRQLVQVRDGKKGSRRVGFLNDYAAEVLERYVTRARELCATDYAEGTNVRLFFLDFDRLGHVVNDELKTACARAGVPRITSHGFRHALGYHLLRSGTNLRHIQAILGHKMLKDTETYTKIDAQDVKEVFDACHPRMHG
jgi:site-specific recombinase XerD